MKSRSLSRPAPAKQPATRFKRSALATFRAVRTVAAGVARIPGNMHHLGREVAAAWRESAKS